MSDSISNFFETWEIEDAELRMEKIKGSVAADVQYDDPRTPESVNGITALSDYVGMFSANAPGWSAKVIKSEALPLIEWVGFIASPPQDKDPSLQGGSKWHWQTALCCGSPGCAP